MATTPGSCVCGAVQYELTAPARGFQYCHCSRCRKKTGSAFAPNLFVRADDLRWIAGEENCRRFELPDANWWSTAFCDTCGSAVPWLSRNGKLWIVAAGTLDGDPDIRASQAVYYGSRGEWYEHGADIPLHDTMPPRK